MLTNIIFGEWTSIKLSSEDVKKLLKDGYSIYTEATSMFDGSHRWYLSKKGEIRCYGSGSNWRDQNSFTTLSNEEAYQSISDKSQEEDILIDVD